MGDDLQLVDSNFECLYGRSIKQLRLISDEGRNSALAGRQSRLTHFGYEADLLICLVCRVRGKTLRIGIVWPAGALLVGIGAVLNGDARILCG